jgi:hypothetical protein
MLAHVQPFGSSAYGSDYLLRVMVDVRTILADIRDILARKRVDYRREGF